MRDDNCIFCKLANGDIPDFATFSILTTEKYIENTAFGLYFFTSML